MEGGFDGARRDRVRTSLAIAGVLAAAIFAADLISPLQGAVAVLYIIVILLVARTGNRGGATAAGFVCALLALAAFAADHLGDPLDAAYVRFGVSLTAIAATTYLSVQQLRSEAERRRSERRYRSIFDGAGFPIWESDWSGTRKYLRDHMPEGTDIRTWFAQNPAEVRAAVGKAVVGDANQAAADLFGGTRAAMVGRSQVGEHAPGTEAVVGDILATLAEGAEMAENDVRYLTPDGRIVDVVLRVRMLDGEGWSRALLIALDVTERNEARARVEQTLAELAHAARVATLGQLAASIAHEVNQPLAAIINYAKSGKRWLSHDAPDIGETTTCLDHIVANGNRAADVVARVRMQARKGVPVQEPVEMADLIREAIDLVGREARAAGVAIRVVGEPPCPGVIGDRVQIQQVLVNLLVNAIQAMRDVIGRSRQLQIGLSRQGDSIRLAVTDNGSGIPGDPARIFDPFFTTKSDGMGIGLSICRSIIEAQGGSIEAANNPVHGATIAFTLPVTSAQPSIETSV